MTTPFDRQASDDPSSNSLERKRYEALKKWAETLESVHSTVTGKVTAAGGSRASDIPMGMSSEAYQSMTEYHDRWGDRVS